MTIIGRIKYRFSHSLEIWCQLIRMNWSYMVQSVREFNGQVALLKLREMRGKMGLHNLRHLSTLALVIALSLGLYNRWAYSNNVAILTLAIMGLFVFMSSCVCSYYFSMEKVGTALIQLWGGCFLGLISFSESSKFKDEPSETAMNAMFIVSILFKFFWNILEIFVYPKPSEPTLLRLPEFLELCGMTIASFTMASSDSGPLVLLILSFMLTIVSVRLKSMFGILNLVLLSIITGVLFFPALRIKLEVNPFGLVCFALRMLVKPLLEWHFCPLTVLERWQSFLLLSVVLRHMSVLAIALTEIVYFTICAIFIPMHKEWYIVVPIFAAFGVVWFCCHSVFIVTCWQLMKKVTVCNMTFHYATDDNKNMNRIMASKGIRHFSLISQRLTWVTLLTTALIGVVTWETRTVLSLSMLLVVIPIEGMVLSLLLEMGSVLGGRCIGYAMVAPALYHRPDGQTTLVSQTMIQESAQRSMYIISIVEKFFSHHMVHIFGCDYSSSGLTLESVQTKLKAFFEKNTEDGPRYDTYIVYYSGHTYDNGDWALSGNAILQLDQLLEMWREKNGETGARLILILDTEHSYKWLRSITKNSKDIIALQTCRISRSSGLDPEELMQIRVGDFSRDWVVYNCTPPSPSVNPEQDDFHWSSKERALQPEYSVSRHWTDFTFHLPTEHDITHHWDSNFPRVTRPLVKCISCSCIDSGSICCCDCVLRCLRRKKMSWFPPKELDTGHGFKLIRS